MWRVRDSIEQCLAHVGAKEFQVWLSDKAENNFRYAIYPEYKANRTRPAPKYLPDVLEYLQTDWQANIAIGQEADDALGIEQMRDDTQDTIICSIDKDLLQIPGKHFNFVKGVFQEVSYYEGIRHFYKQTLIGDRSDNIFGVDGIGAVKASRAIDHLQSEGEMFETALRHYEGNRERLIMNCKVLWIRQKENQHWEPPIVAESKN